MMGILLAEDRSEALRAKRVVDMNVRGKPKSDPVFDGWLNHHLSRLYGPILDEPIPDNLLRLLEEKLR
jgi:hypothetical protein